MQDGIETRNDGRNRKKESKEGIEGIERTNSTGKQLIDPKESKSARDLINRRKEEIEDIEMKYREKGRTRRSRRNQSNGRKEESEGIEVLEGIKVTEEERIESNQPKESK